MKESNERKSRLVKLDERALRQCGSGIRQLLLMDDEAIIQAKENDEKRIRAELERIKKECKERGEPIPFKREFLRREPEPFPHPILGPVIIDRLRKVPIKVRAIVNFAGNADDLEAMGIEVHSHVHDVFTITATKEQLADLASQPATCRVNLPRKFHWTLHDAVPQAEVDQIHALGTRGQGTIVGLLDSTLDIIHHAFRDPAAPHNTRVLFMWVQDPETPAGADPPGETPQQYSNSHPGAPNFAGLNYGRIYDAGAINTALGLPQTYGTGAGQIATITPDQNSIEGQHGTHVAGIAAGSGLDVAWNPGANIGAAPLADIVFVAYDLEEDHALDALNFVYQIAGNRNQPAVVNLSFGSGRGAHDGKSDYDTGRDAMLFSHNGRSMVCGAGNDNDEQAFRRGTIGTGQTEPAWELHTEWSPVSVILNIWYTGPELDYRISCGGNNTGWKTANEEYHSHWPPLGGAIQDGPINGYEIHTYRDSEPRPNWRSILVWIPQASNIDDWTIEFRNLGTSEVNYWAWLDQGNTADLAGFTQDELTLSDDACCKGVLTVGACEKPVGANPEVIWGGSGCGPTQDGRIKPEITVVACNIWSAEAGSTGGYVQFAGGTSMAAPLVTGAIALLLENDPNLNQDTIKGLLTQTADRTGLDIDPGAPGYDPIERNQYGFGRLRMLAPFQHSLPLVDVDVWVRTADDDYGSEPYPGDCFCHAPEVRVFDSSGNEVTTLNWDQEHRVRVRVRNLGDTPAINTLVKLKYTRPWTAPDDWKPCQDPSNISIDQTVNIPALGYHEFDFTQRWKPEQAELPPGGAEWGDHYCLLVELVHDNDPLQYDDSTAEGRDPWNRNIKGTNNVALRNLHIH